VHELARSFLSRSDVPFRGCDYLGVYVGVQAMSLPLTWRIARIGAALIVLAGTLCGATPVRAEIAIAPMCTTTDSMAVIDRPGDYHCDIRSGHFECAPITQVCVNADDPCNRFITPALQARCRNWRKPK